MATGNAPERAASWNARSVRYPRQRASACPPMSSPCVAVSRRTRASTFTFVGSGCTNFGSLRLACVRYLLRYAWRLKPPKSPPLSNDSGRPPTPAVDRLKHCTWIRQLRTHQAIRDICDSGGDLPARGLWSSLASALFSDLPVEAMKRGNLQAVTGIVQAGTDPTRLVRRVDPVELDGPALEAIAAQPGAKRVDRCRSGTPKGSKGASPRETVTYQQITLDLVAQGERLAPGSADWMSAGFWALAGPALPRLEDLRQGLSALKQRLGLCTPHLEEMLPHLLSIDQVQRARRTEDEWKAAYWGSLVPIANQVGPDSLSLLAGLVAETFMTDQSTLHNLHRRAFAVAMEQLLAQPLMAELAPAFRALVGHRILVGSWELPATFHVSSLTAPFMSTQSFERMRLDSFGGLAPLVEPRG